MQKKFSEKQTKHKRVLDIILITVPKVSRWKMELMLTDSPAKGNEGKVWRDGSIVSIGSCGIISKGPVSSVLDSTPRITQ